MVTISQFYNYSPKLSKCITVCVYIYITYTNLCIKKVGSNIIIAMHRTCIQSELCGVCYD